MGEDEVYRKGRGTGWVVVEGDKTAKGKEGWDKVGREWRKEGGGKEGGGK